ncbi:MAG: thermonuclease family protein [Gammaproteobacteria bacterium]
MPSGTAVLHATGAFGRLFALWLLGCAAVVADPCLAPPMAETVEVRRVVDGDTLLLNDGRRVRMVGLDAPELGRDGTPHAPYALEARAHLVTLVELANGQVFLSGDALDRYGRVLAVAYSERHGDLAAHLLRNGFAFVAPVPPNLTGSPCQRTAERQARDAGVGVWRDGAVPVDATQLNATGFAVVRGRSGDWTVRREDRLLSFRGGFRVRIRNTDAERWFNDIDFERYARAQVEVRGWVHPWGRGGRAITVQHPAAIEVVTD